MKRNPRTVCVLTVGLIEPDGRQWIEVMPTTDKARNGPWFFTITAADLDVYADSIRAQPGLIPVDYDHAGADGGSTEAAGWFTGEAKVVTAGAETPDGETHDRDALWAEVKWTPQAMQEIKDGRFKRISPEFDFVERDKKSGLLSKAKEIVAATLTNRPFFRELTPVGADVLWDDSMGYAHLRDEVNEALNGDDPNWRYYVLDVGDGKALVGECMGDDAWIVPFTLDDQGEVQLAPRGEWTEAEQQWVAAARERNERLGIKPQTNPGGEAAPTEGVDMDLKILAAALGLPEDASEEQVLAAAKAANKTPEPKPVAKVTDLAEVRAALGLADDADEATILVAARRAHEAVERIDDTEEELEAARVTAQEKTKLEQRVKALEAERTADKVKSILREGVRAGKLLPAEKSVLAKTFAANPDALLELLETRPERAFRELGTGDSAEEPEAVRTVKKRFESEEADGVDTESAIVHARAEQILREQGKRTYTDVEYLEALELAHADA